ncbi:MAG: efflux RND transporter periplasmic adaptor subunit [Limnobacter sp.]|nr:efflux RND transporter periplasmic adaptor subunit [Limnobacter sp.]
MLDSVKRRWPWWLVALLAIGALAFQFAPRAREVEFVVVERGRIVQSIVATGRIETPARIELSSQVAARIESIDVREGDRVSRGQVLVRLRSDEAEAALAAARAALREAEARQAQLEQVQRPVAAQQLAQARANLSAAERELERARDLVARGFVSQSRIDEAQRLVDTARAAAESAQTQVDGLRVGGVEAELARTRIEQARASLASADARLDTLVLRAPADGVVLTRLAEPGDTAQVGRVLLTMAQAGATRIIASVDERNLRWLRQGQLASAVADAFPSRPFEARISYVAPSIDAQRATVEVWLVVDEPPEFLRPDMTVSVEMIVGSRDDALLLPAWLLLDADPTATAERGAVLAMRDGRARRTEVTLGLRGVGTVEVLDGLVEGDRVITPESGASDGESVRSRQSRGSVNLRELPRIDD